MKKKNKAILLLGVMFCLLQFSAFSQKQVAITIDDPTTKATPKWSWQERDSLILQALDRHHIKTALFVCGMRVNDPNGKVLLNHWNAKNHLICNHSYSHLYFNAKSRTSEAFMADFHKGDSLIRNFSNYTRLFRFPYLKEGNTSEKRDSMRTALSKEAYRNGHVTIDASDWYIDAQITKALNEDINADLRPYKEYYIKHILDRANYYDSLAQLVFKRNIKHTLLIHHSLLNALFLEDLLQALEQNGWELIDAQTAYQDSVFLMQPNIEPCGESIVWQCAKQIKALENTLRYPAEDGVYEQAPLEQYLKEYQSKNK